MKGRSDPPGLFKQETILLLSLLGPIYTVRLCRMRQRLTTGPRHDLR